MKKNAFTVLQQAFIAYFAWVLRGGEKSAVDLFISQWSESQL